MQVTVSDQPIGWSLWPAPLHILSTIDIYVIIYIQII